ncbi:endoglucanase V-like protein, partial [Russula aff. rugulosa BPL654]
MKSALLLVLASLSSLVVVACQNATCDPNGWVQNPSGCATFTSAHNCATPSCGVNFTSGFTAAVNELAFGSNHSFGDACGRCFNITPTADLFAANFSGPFGNSIIVNVNNLCVNHAGSQHNFCGQTVSNPKNDFGESMHFDLCDLTGASQAFFPPGRQAMRGTFQEVSCTLWQGSTGTPIWNGSCMAPQDAPFWPTPACGNRGSAPC